MQRLGEVEKHVEGGATVGYVLRHLSGEVVTLASEVDRLTEVVRSAEAALPDPAPAEEAERDAKRAEAIAHGLENDLAIAKVGIGMANAREKEARAERDAALARAAEAEGEADRQYTMYVDEAEDAMKAQIALFATLARSRR